MSEYTTNQYGEAQCSCGKWSDTFAEVCEDCIDKAASYDNVKRERDALLKAAKDATALLKQITNSPVGDWPRLIGETFGTLNFHIYQCERKPKIKAKPFEPKDFEQPEPTSMAEMKRQQDKGMADYS